jgi:hypothetical protein
MTRVFCRLKERQEAMTLTIELSDDLEAALTAHAEASGVSVAGYARRVLEEAIYRTGRHGARLNGQRFKNLSDLLLNSPFAGSGLDLERLKDYPRPVHFE